MSDFKAFPKIPRYNREVIVTEKIDGTNGCVVIEDGKLVAVQSRNRNITVDDDNFGFAKWAYGHADDLAVTLGNGYHFGEWWGNGIQRGYGLAKDDKRFSLFNTSRWGTPEAQTYFSAVPGLGVVPVVGIEPRMGGLNWAGYIAALKMYGSLAAPGFMDPEGIVIYQTAGNHLYKITCKDDEKPKGQA